MGSLKSQAEMVDLVSLESHIGGTRNSWRLLNFEDASLFLESKLNWKSLEAGPLESGRTDLDIKGRQQEGWKPVCTWLSQSD